MFRQKVTIMYHEFGNYDPVFVGIGIILFTALILSFVWIYYKGTRKEGN